MNNIHGIHGIHGNCKLGLLARALLSSAILMIKIKDLNNPYLQNTFDEGGHEAAREPEPGRPEGDRLHLTRCCEQHSPMRGHQLCIHITANNQQKIEFHIERMSQYPPTLLSSRIWNLFRCLLQHGNMRVRDENTHACVSETHGSCMFHNCRHPKVCTIGIRSPFPSQTYTQNAVCATFIYTVIGVFFVHGNAYTHACFTRG